MSRRREPSGHRLTTECRGFGAIHAQPFFRVALMRGPEYGPNMRLRRWAMLMTCAALLAAGCSGGRQPGHARFSGTTSTGLAAGGGSCSSEPPISPLPTWARAGFSPPDAPMPHVLGDRGDIVAIL